jgi:hypothetical protein
MHVEHKLIVCNTRTCIAEATVEIDYLCIQMRNYWPSQARGHGSQGRGPDCHSQLPRGLRSTLQSHTSSLSLRVRAVWSNVVWKRLWPLQDRPESAHFRRTETELQELTDDVMAAPSEALSINEWLTLHTYVISIWIRW